MACAVCRHPIPVYGDVAAAHASLTSIPMHMSGSECTLSIFFSPRVPLLVRCIDLTQAHASCKLFKYCKVFIIVKMKYISISHFVFSKEDNR